MPEVERAEKNGHVRHTIKIQPNEKVMLCRCYKSATFPFCDVTHRHTEDELGPIIVEVVQEKDETQAEG